MNGIFKRINPYIEAHTYGKNFGEIFVTFFSKILTNESKLKEREI